MISVCRSVSFCNKVKVASCICVSAKLVRVRRIAVAAPRWQLVPESRLRRPPTYFTNPTLSSLPTMIRSIKFVYATTCSCNMRVKYAACCKLIRYAKSYNTMTRWIDPVEWIYPHKNWSTTSVFVVVLSLFYCSEQLFFNTSKWLRG